ncbi:hypothetical protein C7447_10187 [Tenacibaculum adriaticum]|uniref:Uncharacterized protein n=1 Tax=Tenacibaculum adriaticum TaxID=413713 RepID=A0A5S5DUC2_9FLAO|nr:hypothetical protein [Tenacibaculum adriaticum]TYP99487.1 hypothetical protein C7447_10187 [Tenacibaculum adriaticum]
MIDFEKILKELKNVLLTLFKEKYSEFKSESVKDIDEILKQSRDRLERWTLLLAEGKLTLEDFEWLLNAQKDLLHMKALHKVGVSKISLGHFKNKVIKTIFDVIKGFVF